ncbi:MAG: cytochrome b N-terminal domain-containing protein [Desulfuromonadia bacterium]
MIADFVRHLFPRVILRRNLRITYTFCLGGLAFTMLLILFCSGVLLMFYYHPSPSDAYRSILFLESSVAGGLYLRSIHRLASHLLLLLLGLHLLRVVLTGAYAPPRHLAWVVGMLLLFLSVFGGYSGYLLPLDQRAYWATRTGMELLATIPGGGIVRALLTPDGVGGPLSLQRFYVLHVMVVPLSLMILVMLHFYQIRKTRGVLPYL